MRSLLREIAYCKPLRCLCHGRNWDPKRRSQSLPQKRFLAALPQVGTERPVCSLKLATPCRKQRMERPAGEGNMIYFILFLALCAVIAANILVVVIALRKAYREETRIRRVSQRVRTGFVPG